MKRALAIDLGASTGRAILGTLENGTLRLEEIHRFENRPKETDGAFRWDLDELMDDIRLALKLAHEKGGYDCIGIDTWGVDFGLLDENGTLLETPLHYRDESSLGMVEHFCQGCPQSELYRETGLQMMHINSLFQLEACKTSRPEIFRKAKTLLMMPCLIAYLLTGEKKNEYTAVSTSQLLNAATKTPSARVLGKLGLTEEFLGEIVPTGCVLGHLSEEVCQSLGIPSVPVIAVGMHDTASAVAAVPTQEKDFIYISSGTWSLFGTELDAPETGDDACRLNLANEGGVFGKIRLLKNIMGLWLVQESRRQFKREGDEGVTFADLEREARAAAPFTAFITPDTAAFEAPGDLPERIRAFCRESGQHVPETRGELMRTIYEGLAFRYRKTLAEIEELTGRRFDSIHIVGGGTKDDFLSQFTANATGRRVTAGPTEATAMGNLLLQFYATGEVKDLSEIRRISENSFAIKEFLPQDTALWDEMYENWREITRDAK
ncbi:MAG: rhamnulokinase [Clostridia bacterium]|nr:rhamnulokinase [Clostridia bacterium]